MAKNHEESQSWELIEAGEMVAHLPHASLTSETRFRPSMILENSMIHIISIVKPKTFSSSRSSDKVPPAQTLDKTGRRQLGVDSRSPFVVTFSLFSPYICLTLTFGKSFPVVDT